MRAVEETAARRCHGIWAYSEPQGDLFDDTVSESGTMGMAFIDPRDGSRLSTRHWEAYREVVTTCGIWLPWNR
jgi:hypothetical protein